MEEGDLPVATAVNAPVQSQPGAYYAPPSAMPEKKEVVVQQAVQVTKAPAATSLGPVSTGGIPFLRRKPAMLNQCPHCAQQSRTRIRTWPNVMTWLGVLILLLLFWPLFWIPFVFDSCKQTDHFCVMCDNKVGSAYPMQDCCEKNRS